MFLQLAGIVIARQIQVIEPWDNSAVHNLNDVGFLQVLRHPADGRAILGQGRLAVTLPIAFDHLRQIKVDLITGTVLYQRQPGAVANLATD